MTPKSKKVKVISDHLHEFSSNMTVNNITYHVQTEVMSKKTHKINSRIYLQGEVIFSKKTDFSHLTKLNDFESKLQTLMETLHRTTIANFIEEQSHKQKTQKDYLASWQASRSPH